MQFLKNIYNTKTLLGMLDIAISEMIENEACNFCALHSDKPQKACLDEDLCKSYMFEGLLKELRRRN